MTHFDPDYYLPVQRSPKQDRNYNHVERNVSNTKEEFLTSDYNAAGSSRHVQSFDKIQKEEFASRLNIPKSQDVKDKIVNMSEKEGSTHLKEKIIEAKEKTLVTVIKQEKEIEPEKDQDEGENVAEEKDTKYETVKKEEIPSSLSTAGENKSKEMEKEESKAKVKTEDNKDQAGNDFSFLDWKDGIATLPGNEPITLYCVASWQANLFCP